MSHNLYVFCGVFYMTWNVAGVPPRSRGGVENVNTKSVLELHSLEASSSVTSTDLTGVRVEVEFEFSS